MKTETIEIEVTASTTEKREITLPLYRIDNCHAYKVISKDKCISVCHNDYCDSSITQCTSEVAFNYQKTQDCSKSEFDAMYQKTAMKLALLATD